ncbi:MAG: hypothetical protein ABIO16_02500, partial [Nocardioides sp.]
GGGSDTPLPIGHPATGQGSADSGNDAPWLVMGLLSLAGALGAALLGQRLTPTVGRHRHP